MAINLSSFRKRLADLEDRVSHLERHLSKSNVKESSTNVGSVIVTTGDTALERDAFVDTARVRALALGFRDFLFKRCPDHYYDVSLEKRKEILGAPSIHHLCKSIVMMNTRCTNDDCRDPLNSRYYCIVVQYTRKLNGEKVFRFVRGLNAGRGISRKSFNFQLARDSEDISGFDHNAVTPLGMKTRMPVILAQEILQLDPKEFWLGGGDVSLKWRVKINEFRRAFNPFIGDITFDNGDSDLE